MALPSNLPAFIPVQLPTTDPAPASVAHDIKVEIRKSALTMSITRPTSASADFASWVASILK